VGSPRNPGVGGMGSDKLWDQLEVYVFGAVDIPLAGGYWRASPLGSMDLGLPPDKKLVLVVRPPSVGGEWKATAWLGHSQVRPGTTFP